jgi:hypothetical protein
MRVVLDMANHGCLDLGRVGQRMVLPDLSMLGKLVEQVVQLAHRCMIELAVLEFRLIRCTVE